MKKLSVDTCVFLKLVSTNEKLKEKGNEGFAEFLDENYVEMMLLKDEMKKLMIEKYVISDRDCPFENMVEGYCRYIITNLQKQNKIISNYIKGDHYVNNGATFIKKPTYEEYKQAQAFVNEVRASQFSEEILDDLKSEYLIHKLDYYAGTLLTQAICGDVELCITSTTFREIKNHIIGMTNGKTKGALYHKETVADFLKEYITYIKVDESVRGASIDVTEKFSTKAGEETSPMKKDRNSKDEYGDLYIMSEASLAGVPLVTLNLKDFIWDRPDSSWNEKIRNNIKSVILSNEKMSEALPFSVEEVVEGNYIQSDKESELVKLTHIDGKNVYSGFEFKDEYEMGAS